jgi:DNA-binding beta-propeller fold protein YncE
VRRLALLVALAALVAPAARARERPLYAELSHGAKGELVRVDPATLAIQPGPRIALGLHDMPWTRSPDGKLLAVGSGRTGSVSVVDLAAGRVVRDLPLPSTSLALAWPAGDRLLVVTQRCCPSRLRALALDPASGRVVGSSQLGPGTLVAATATVRGLVLLLGAQGRLADARLALVAPDGSGRSVTLPGFPAGFVPAKPNTTAPIMRYATPALAVDPAGRRAYVVAHAPQVAAVDLRTLAVTVHALPERSLADGGISVGFYRRAVWAGDAVLALTGHDDALAGNGARAAQTTSAFGLRLVDTRTWTVRIADQDATAVAATAAGLLATASVYDPLHNRSSGGGVTLYDARGRRLWHALGRRALDVLPSAGSRAYVFLGNAYGTHTAIVLDLATGKATYERVPGWLDVLGAAPQTCWC